MIIAELKKRENIVEYVIYMMQIQDILRANNFEINQIEKLIIDNYGVSAEEKERIKNWYLELIKSIKSENVEQKGNIKIVTDLFEKLNQLHLYMLSDKENSKHHEIYSWAKPNIEEYKKLSKSESENEIEICIDAMYSLLLLRLQKKPVSEDTAQAMQTFSNLLANVASEYHKKS